MWTRRELKSYAKQKLSFSYWPIVGWTFLLTMVPIFFDIEIPADDLYMGGLISVEVYMLLLDVSLILSIASLILGIFVFPPLKVGLIRFYLNLETRTQSWKDIFYPFKHHYWNVVGILLLRDIFTFLWALLFIIPGIVKSYEYSQIPYLLAEDPGLRGGVVFRATKRMMDGNKMDAFVLDLSFIGWCILSIFTAGILFIFFVVPYYNLTMAELYLVLRERVNYLFDDPMDKPETIVTEGVTETPYYWNNQ